MTRLEHLPILHDASAGLEPGAEEDWIYESVDGLLKPGSTTTFLGQRVTQPAVDLTKTQTVALDGRTGKERVIGAPADGRYEARDLTLVGDLSGDGRDDVVATPPWSFMEKRTGTVSALRSTDGAALWQRPTPAANATAVGDVGRFTGDRRTDLVVVPFDIESRGPVTFTFVDGANGRTLWSRRGTTGGVVAGRRPLAIIAGLGGSSRRAAATVSAYDVRNRAVFTRRFTAAVPKGSDAEFATLGALGDVDGDGTEDLVVGVGIVTRTRSGNTLTIASSVRRVGAVSGATGRALPKYDDRTYPLDASLDGRGDDVETDGRTGARIRDGRTGRTLLVVDVGRPVTAIVIGTLRADRDRCLDVFVAANLDLGAAPVYGVVSGATGRVLWQATDGARTTARITTSGRAYRCR